MAQDEAQEPVEVEGTSVEERVSSDPFVELLTPAAKARLILPFLKLRGDRLSPSEVCERASVGRDAWYRHHEDLLKYGIIEEAGNVGNSPMYRSDPDDELVQKLRDVFDIAGHRHNQSLHAETEQ